nr:tol-pal system protein YbgF [Klebsiella pneumoniae]
MNYNKGRKDDAAFYFASVVKNYPKSPKAPDAMFKVGVIMQDKGDTAKAKAVYQQVINKFPGTDGAKQAQNDLMLLVDYGMTRNRVISGLVA